MSGGAPEVRAEAGAAERRSRNPIRRLYDWVLGFAGRPSGPLALFLLAAAEAVFFPIPPDVLLIPLSLGRPSRALRFALLCTVGSVGGALLGYWAGSTLYDTIGRPILELYGYGEVYRTVGSLYRQNLVVALGSAGFTPIPYKVFTIAAGGFKVPLLPFVAISAVSRGARFFLVAGLLRAFGEPVRDFIDRYFNVLTVALVVLIVAGFLAVHWLLGGG
ncbi:MAG TPA: DedA family protein [Gemmatimonadota bacterium]|nr:DedA family protein [Gemmatimonadota bacterium]